MLRSIGSVAFLALLMVACGGGEDGGSASSPPPPPPTATYKIGGTVTGLTGTVGLVLQTNAGDVVTASAAGAFTFPNRLGSGTAYTVTVQTQPSTPLQHCIVTNGSGTVGTADITAVAVACSTVAGYTVKGTVSGLVGSGLTLTNCTPGWGSSRRINPPICNSVLQVGANGAFTFTLDPYFPAGYSGDFVVIANQPNFPPQNCVISNNTVGDANDTSITVSCTEYAYVTNAADNTLSAYGVDATTGTLAAVGTPTPTGTSPHAIASLHNSFCCGTNDTKFVFVGNEGSNDVSAFAVNSTTGALTAVPGSPFPAGVDPQAMAIDYGLFYLFVANAGSNNVSAYTIDANGALGAPSTIATGNSPTSIVVQRGNAGAVFVANHGGSNDISAFTTNASQMPDGSIHINMTPLSGSPFPAGGSPLSLALAVAAGGGTYLYSANPDAKNPSISGFSVDPATGVLSPLSGSPFPLSVSHYIATDQTGAYLYVTSGADIVGYAIDATTGALTRLPGFPVATGADAYSITIDPPNRFLYVTNDGAARIAGFRLDASTGALTPMIGSPFPAGHHPDFIATF